MESLENDGNVGFNSFVEEEAENPLDSVVQLPGYSTAKFRSPQQLGQF